jgi:hypothetical protein
MKIDPKLIRAEAEQVQHIPASEARSVEIAGEIEALLEGLASVTDALGFFDDPDGLRAVLWELREGAPR